MLLLYIAGLLAAFWIGFFLAAILANERRAEDLEDMMRRIDDIKKRSGLYPDKTGQKWLTWEEDDVEKN
jgi:hypothetical protein